jgi:hypothetical protein
MRKIRVIAASFAAVAAATALTATALPASKPQSITANSIAGAKLGKPAAYYKAAFGAPYSNEPAPGGGPFSRLVFAKRKIAVYFWNGADAGVEIVSWNRVDHTAQEIGPCSSIAQLTASYGSKVVPVPTNTINGAVYVYHVATILFAANGKPPHPSTHVTAVATYWPSLFHQQRPTSWAGFFILSSPTC